MSSSWMISFMASLKPRDRPRPDEIFIGPTTHEPEIPNKARDDNHVSWPCLPAAGCSKTAQSERALRSRHAPVLLGNGGFRRERHLEGESWLWDMDYGGERDAGYYSKWGSRHRNVRIFRYKERVLPSRCRGERYRIQCRRESIHIHQPGADRDHQRQMHH